jgi:integrase
MDADSRSPSAQRVAFLPRRRRPKYRESLFISFRRGDHPQERPLHPNQVERIVKQRAQAVGIAMSPHGMRASFITLAFEGGADLALVQDGARHKDPRTTRRYQKRRENLHKNAVDFVWI